MKYAFLVLLSVLACTPPSEQNKQERLNRAKDFGRALKAQVMLCDHPTVDRNDDSICFIETEEQVYMLICDRVRCIAKHIWNKRIVTYCAEDER